MLRDEEVERALVITAHPDDVDFGAGGTVAKWTSEGIAVSYCVLTDGDAGGFDREFPREQIPRIRKKEQRDAGAVLGVDPHQIFFLGYPDGALVPNLDVRCDISRVIRQVRPQRVVCQSPEWNFDRIAASHPDHRAAGEAALCAVYPDARNPFAHPELLQNEELEDWAVAEVWIMGGPNPNHYEDVTDFFAKKISALEAHISQTSHRSDVQEFLREWMASTAANGGLPRGHLAEAFRVMDTA